METKDRDIISYSERFYMSLWQLAIISGYVLFKYYKYDVNPLFGVYAFKDFAKLGVIVAYVLLYGSIFLIFTRVFFSGTGNLIKFIIRLFTGKKKDKDKDNDSQYAIIIDNVKFRYENIVLKTGWEHSWKEKEEMHIDNIGIKDILKLLHMNFAMKVPLRQYEKEFTNKQEEFLSKDLLYGWGMTLYCTIFGILSFKEFIGLLIIPQFFSSEINRTVIYCMFKLSFRYLRLAISLTGIFGTEQKYRAKLGLGLYDYTNDEEEIESIDESPVNRWLEAPLCDILKKMEFSKPRKSQKSVTGYEKDLNECLQHLNIIKEGSEDKLKVIKTEETFGATILTISVMSVKGLTLEKFKTYIDSISSFLDWSGLRAENATGKGMIQLVIPHEKRDRVLLANILNSDEYSKLCHEHTIFIGKSLDDKNVYVKLKQVPHFLICGTTGSGKSFEVNTILFSLLSVYHPSDFKLGIIDPKGTEFIAYKGFPHLLKYIGNEFEEQLKLVQWAEHEMNRRNIEVFAPLEVKSIDEYNLKHGKLPRILIVIDEYADIVTVPEQKKLFEPVVQRIAQKSRSSGIHLMLLTQKPTVKTIDTVLKSNLGCRIALSMADSNSYRTVLDNYDGTKLQGKGDMLVEFLGKQMRLQGGCLTTDDDVETKLIKQTCQIWQTYGLKSSEIDLDNFKLTTETDNITEDNPDSNIIDDDYSENEEQAEIEQDENIRRKLLDLIRDQVSQGEFFLPGQLKLRKLLHCDVANLRQLIDELRDEGILEKNLDSKKTKMGDKINSSKFPEYEEKT